MDSSGETYVVLARSRNALSNRAQAPGEAEAELAHMNELGLIDGVLTDDSDAFVFGAKCIIRKYVCSLPILFFVF